MPSLKRRYNKWQAKLRVPAHLVSKLRREFVYRTLESSEKRIAKIEALAWEADVRREWAAFTGREVPDRKRLRDIYERTREEVVTGEWNASGSADEDPTELGVDLQIEKLADEFGKGEMSPEASARLAAFQDGLAEYRNEAAAPRPEYDPAFTELAKDYLASWERQCGLKVGTNTKQQKQATLHLFAGFWADKPVRRVTQPDAARFFDAIVTLAPSWGRSSAARSLTWRDLLKQFGGHTSGLSDSTMNRHMAALKAIWDWAKVRGYCEGDNPFDGFHRRLRPGVNVQRYLPWEINELRILLDPPPRRADVHEVVLIGLHSGMRLNEIASLRAEQIREAEGVTYMQIEDAKTPAGNRLVPLHPSIDWLARIARDIGSGPLWPTFNPEGPGKARGADAGREFSRFKRGRGFTDRRKSFHSFRKNVTRIMERNGVPENEWAQIIGHERGFTYSVYNPEGIGLDRKKEIIELIDYPGLAIEPPERD